MVGEYGCTCNPGTFRQLTFADSLKGAHLGAIFHGVQGKVDLRERLLLLDGADSIVKVLGLVHVALLVVLHGGQVWLSNGGEASRKTVEEATRGGWGGSSDPWVAANEYGAEAPLRLEMGQNNRQPYRNSQYKREICGRCRCRRRVLVVALAGSCRAEKAGGDHYLSLAERANEEAAQQPSPVSSEGEYRDNEESKGSTVSLSTFSIMMNSCVI